MTSGTDTGGASCLRASCDEADSDLARALRTENDDDLLWNLCEYDCPESNSGVRLGVAALGG